MLHFHVGQTVEFTDRSKKVLTGTVVQAPRRQSNRSKIVVTVEGGSTYNVPATMLRESTKKVDGGKLAEQGRDLLERRAAHTEAGRPAREARAARQGEIFSSITSELKIGQRVEVFSSGGWSETTIRDIIPETGKVRVDNPAYVLNETFMHLGASGLGRRVQKTITVLANRVRRSR
jgi:hypothetical protein